MEPQIITVDTVDDEERDLEEIIDIDQIIDRLGQPGRNTVKQLIIALSKAIDYKPEATNEGLPKGFWKKETAELDESFEKLVGKLTKQGKSEKAAKAIAGAVANYKAKGGGKGPTAKQKARG